MGLAGIRFEPSRSERWHPNLDDHMDVVPSNDMTCHVVAVMIARLLTGCVRWTNNTLDPIRISSRLWK